MQNTLNFLFSLYKVNSLLSRKLNLNGLDFNDFIILYHLNKTPDNKLRRIDLANLLGLTPSGITRMLLPLEKLGIITRDLNDDDARARFATLTKAGKNLLSDALCSLEIRLSDLPFDSKKNEDSSNYLNSIAKDINI